MDVLPEIVPAFLKGAVAAGIKVRFFRWSGNRRSGASLIRRRRPVMGN